MTQQKFATLTVHAGDAIDPSTNAVDEPIVLSNAFAFSDADEAAAMFRQDQPGWIYGRWASPNGRTLENKVAALEGSEAAVSLSSGMAAVFGAMSACIEAGSHIIAPKGLYAETGRILRTLLKKFGVSSDFVDLRDVQAVEAALRPETSLIWVETPANPTLSIYDIVALSGLARSHGAKCVVDNTFATPFHQNPIALGADAVVHAATKALGGHGDAIAGIVCGDAAFCDRVRDEAVRAAGASLPPFNAWLIARGLRTLALRAERSSQSAMELARRLEGHPKVERVLYPGLASHPEHELAARQMQRGFGSLVAVEIQGGLAAGRTVHDALELITRAVSLGDVKSLMTHPASTTHKSMTPAQRAAGGISEGLMRLSVGIEDVEDLWEDLARGLQAL